MVDRAPEDNILARLHRAAGGKIEFRPPTPEELKAFKEAEEERLRKRPRNQYMPPRFNPPFQRPWPRRWWEVEGLRF